MQKPLPFINFYGKKVNTSVEDKKVNRLILDEAGVWTTNNIENKNKFKTMTDYAIHSPNNGELLIKFHDELVKHGLNSHEKWNKNSNPNFLNEFTKEDGRSVFFYTIYISQSKNIFYISRRGIEINIHYDLTPENFNTVLKEVLQNFGIEYKEQSINSNNMRAAEVKEFEIWVEGYATTGERGSARMIGKGIGSTFDEAVKDYMKKNPKHGIEENKKDRYINDDYYQNRRSNWNIWACNLFDNETDARKSFG